MIGTIKISQLPISSPLDGSENLIINQVGVTKLTTVDDVVGLVTYVSSSGISTVSQGLTGSPDINVTNINSSGIITASGGFVLGISSSGTSITSGPITELNFIGTGNTFAVSGTSVDISIQGGESYWSSSTLGIHTLSNVGIATTDPIQKLQVGSAGTSVVVVDDNGNLGLGTTNPTSKIHCLGDINLDDGGTYVTTLQVITPTADRVISYPDATGTLALVAGSSGQLIYNNAGANAGTPTLTYDGSILTSSGRFINSYNATASSPAKAFTGTWFTGGTATTTKPHVLIEPSGTTSTAWSTSGTGLGINAATGFTGRLIDLQVNGTRNFAVDSTGRVSFPLGAAAIPSLYPGTDTNTGIWSPAADTLAWSTGGTERLRIDSSGRLLVGTSAARGNFFNASETSTFQVEGTSGTTGYGRISTVFNANSAASGAIIIGKTRGSSIGAVTAVNAGDSLGNVSFQGADGTELVPAAVIGAEVDGTPGANDMPGRLIFSTTAYGSATPTEQLRITSDRYVRLASGTGGIQFNGDTAAANALDDYEEGTFTPVVADDATAGNVGVPGDAYGEYTKVGNRIFLQIRLVNIITTGMTAGNDLFIRGLPFTAVNLAGTQYHVGGVQLAAVTTVANVISSVLDNTSYVKCLTNVSGATNGSLKVSDLTSGSADIWLSISYQTA